MTRPVRILAALLTGIGAGLIVYLGFGVYTWTALHSGWTDVNRFYVALSVVPVITAVLTTVFAYMLLLRRYHGFGVNGRAGTNTMRALLVGLTVLSLQATPGGQMADGTKAAPLLRSAGPFSARRVTSPPVIDGRDWLPAHV